jgi:hypothetical protein
MQLTPQFRLMQTKPGGDSNFMYLNLKVIKVTRLLQLFALLHYCYSII